MHIPTGGSSLNGNFVVKHLSPCPLAGNRRPVGGLFTVTFKPILTTYFPTSLSIDLRFYLLQLQAFQEAKYYSILTMTHMFDACKIQ